MKISYYVFIDANYRGSEDNWINPTPTIVSDGLVKLKKELLNVFATDGDSSWIKFEPSGEPGVVAVLDDQELLGWIRKVRVV